MSSRFRWLVALGCVAVLALLAAGPAAAQEPRPVVQSCVTTSAVNGCTAATPFRGAVDVAVSPDGRHAYAAAFNDAALISFDREAATGGLTQTGCISNTGAGACEDGRALSLPSDVEVSPDGRHVYLASQLGGVTVYDRDEDTGALTQTACLSHNGTDGGQVGVCTDVRGLDQFQGPFAMRLSPAGDHVYVAAAVGTLLTFDRDEVSGQLTQKAGTSGCMREDGTQDCFNGTGMGSIRQFAISADGRNVYLPSGTRSGVLILDRDRTTGALTQKSGTAGCITFDGFGAQCRVESRLSGGGPAVELSPDGRHLYALVDDKVIAFDRGAGGQIAFSSCVSDPGAQGCTDVRNTSNLLDGRFSPDGEDLVVNNGPTRPGLALLRRDPDTGRLSQVAGPDACLSNDGSARDDGAVVPGACRSHPAVGASGRIVFTGKDQFYAAFLDRSSVVALKRDFPPECRDAALDVAHNTTTAVPLSCSDRNGDPVSLEIAGQPGAGQLGAIDQPAGRVFYSPFAGFSGPDAFSYRATAAGLASDPATVRLSVAGAPPAPPAAAPAIDADGDGFFAAQDCDDADAAIRPGAREVKGDRIDENCDGRAEIDQVGSRVSSRWEVAGARFRLVQLAVREIPRGGRVELECVGRRCPFDSERAARPRRGTVNALKALPRRDRRFRAGQRLEVTVTAPRFNGRVTRLKLRAGKIPRGKDRCLPLGSDRPRKRC